MWKRGEDTIESWFVKWFTRKPQGVIGDRTSCYRDALTLGREKKQGSKCTLKFSHQSGRVKKDSLRKPCPISGEMDPASLPDRCRDVGLCDDPLNLLENRCIHGRLGIWDGVGEMDEKSGSTPGLLHQQEAPFSGPATSPSVAKFSSPSPCLDTGFWTPEEEWLHRDNLSKGFPLSKGLETGLLLSLA